MTIESLPSFRRELKHLAKKYPSIPDDYAALLASLQNDPQQGEALGKNCYKVYFAIASKKTGKRDSSRLITCVRIEKTPFTCWMCMINQSVQLLAIKS
jgi:hypothetical protein